MMKLLRNRSLSFKLVLLFLFTVVAMVTVLRLSSGGAFVNRLELSIRPHIKNYYHYLNKDIGTPPNLEVAKQLSESLKLNITIKGPDLQWSSNSEPAPKEFSKIYSNKCNGRKVQQRNYNPISKSNVRIVKRSEISS